MNWLRKRYGHAKKGKRPLWLLERQAKRLVKLVRARGGKV
jgi:hypothetical protein